MKFLFRQLAEFGGWLIEDPFPILAIGIVMVGVWGFWMIKKFKERWRQA